MWCDYTKSEKLYPSHQVVFTFHLHLKFRRRNRCASCDNKAKKFYITLIKYLSNNMQQPELKKRQLLELLLASLESELRQQTLWQSERPSEQALASSEPFAIDFLNFTQWLQFIFIEKMSVILQLDLPLPNAMSVAPMATEYFKVQTINCTEIVALITRIDLIINEKVSC